MEGGVGVGGGSRLDEREREDVDRSMERVKRRRGGVVPPQKGKQNCKIQAENGPPLGFWNLNLYVQN